MVDLDKRESLYGRKGHSGLKFPYYGESVAEAEKRVEAPVIWISAGPVLPASRALSTICREESLSDPGSPSFLRNAQNEHLFLQMLLKFMCLLTEKVVAFPCSFSLMKLASRPGRLCPGSQEMKAVFGGEPRPVQDLFGDLSQAPVRGPDAGYLCVAVQGVIRLRLRRTPPLSSP